MASHLATSLDHSWRNLMHVERVSTTYLDSSSHGKHMSLRKKTRVTRPITYFGGILNNRNDPTRLLTGPRPRRRKSLHKDSAETLDSEIDSVLLSRSWYREGRGVRRSQGSSRTELGEGEGRLMLTGKRKEREHRGKKAPRSSSTDSGYMFLVQNSVPKDLWSKQRVQYLERSRTAVSSSRPRSQAASHNPPLALFCNEGIRKSVESDEEITHPPPKPVKAVIVIPSF